MYSVIFLVLLGIAAIIFFNGLRTKNKAKISLGVIIGLLSAGFFWFMGFWGEVLWYKALGFGNRFWLEIVYNVICGLGGLLVSLVGSYLLTKLIPKDFKYVKWIAILIAAISRRNMGIF